MKLPATRGSNLHCQRSFCESALTGVVAPKGSCRFGCFYKLGVHALGVLLKRSLLKSMFGLLIFGTSHLDPFDGLPGFRLKARSRART